MDIIIGAGVTGLSFAAFSKTNDYLIFEKENKVGGLCRTFKQNDFIWDYSGHFFHFRNNNIKNFIFDRVSKQKIYKHNKNTKIFYKNRFIDFPFQKNIYQLEKEDFIDCIYDLYFRSNCEGDSFASMILGKFGKSISEKFLYPYNEKLYACDLDTLDKESMGRFLPYTSFEDVMKNMKVSKNTSYNSSFLYAENGAFEFIKAILTEVDDNRINLSKKINNIDLQRKIVTISDGTEYKYDNLISTIPYPDLLTMCHIDYNEESFTSNKVVVFNLGFNMPSEREEHWIYYPNKNISFYRVGFYNNILSNDRMSLYVEIGLKEKDVFDEKELLKRVLFDLKKVSLIDEHKLIAYNCLVINPAYVHINNKAKEEKKKYDIILRENNVYSIGRYGSWTYCSIEDNIIEAKELSLNLAEKRKLKLR